MSDSIQTPPNNLEFSSVTANESKMHILVYKIFPTEHLFNLSIIKQAPSPTVESWRLSFSKWTLQKGKTLYFISYTLFKSWHIPRKRTGIIFGWPIRCRLYTAIRWHWWFFKPCRVGKAQARSKLGQVVAKSFTAFILNWIQFMCINQVNMKLVIKICIGVLCNWIRKKSLDSFNTCMILKRASFTKDFYTRTISYWCMRYVEIDKNLRRNYLSIYEYLSLLLEVTGKELYS